MNRSKWAAIRRVLDGLNLAHEMPVVIAVVIVVSQNPAMIHEALFQVDVCKAVRDYLPILEPDLLFKDRALALASERCDLGQYRLDRARFSTDRNILSQKGYRMSCLKLLLHRSLSISARRIVPLTENDLAGHY
jgi:hypothetical protein